MTTLFITGIDTDIGKSIACGALAKTLIDAGHHVFTQKLIETGCPSGQSADLATHEAIVGSRFNTAAAELHCPITFSYPASPHLAAAQDNQSIDCDYLVEQINALQQQCDHLLIEGAGGLYVPLNLQTTFIDFIADRQLAIVLVTSGKLGSINHTLLSLAACQQHGIPVKAIVYNRYCQDDTTILNDTRNVLTQYSQALPSPPLWLELASNTPEISMSPEQIETLLS